MPKTISDAGLSLIKAFEGCRLTAYKCLPSEQYYTIGWGHYGPDVSAGQTITQEQADDMLRNDLHRYEAYVNDADYCPQTDSLNQSQFDALVSFCYNCGPGNLDALCHDNATLDAVAADMLAYNKGGGKVLPGLVRRRQAEVDLFNSNVPDVGFPITEENESEETFEMEMRMLRRGDSGNDVFAAMTLMKAHGYYDGTPDDLFGPRMEQGLLQMQRDNDLGADGLLGKASWTYLLK